jgi:hypothetical protein
VALLSILALVSGSAVAFSGRKAVLHRLVEVKLAQNPPYVPGTSDCSFHMWDLVSRVLPELRAHRWFVRSTAAAMARWPWPRVFTLVDARFGDLFFYRKHPAGRIAHVGMAWDRPGRQVHASSSRGFTAQPLGRYWRPKLARITRPPFEGP